jgi:hypothetical protein
VPAWPVGELVCEGAAQHPQGDRVAGDRGESEALACGAADPGPEPGVTQVEVEPAEYQVVPGADVAAELLCQADGVVDGFDDHPFFAGAAERHGGMSRHGQ